MRPMNYNFRAYEVCTNFRWPPGFTEQRRRRTGVEPLNLVIIYIMQHHISESWDVWPLYSCATGAVFSEVRDHWANRERRAQLTRCLSAVAELLVCTSFLSYLGLFVRKTCMLVLDREIDVTRCQILRIKCIKFDFRWAFAPSLYSILSEHRTCCTTVQWPHISRFLRWCCWTFPRGSNTSSVWWSTGVCIIIIIIN